jgi:hypothetical protein
MAYSTVDQVQTWLAHVSFDEEFYPTRTQITNDLITASDAEIDSKLSDGWSTPITNATDIILLRDISVRLTCGRIARILYGERGDADGNSVLWRLLDEGNEMLDDLISGARKLQTTRAAFVGLGVYSVFAQDTPITIVSQVTPDKEF